MSAREIGGGLVAILVFGLQFLFLASASGIVKEHCLASEPTNLQDVESGWTYIVWPPLIFTAADPPGRCVRNTIGREALGAVGIWALGTPAEQVEDHLRKQAKAEGSEDLFTLLETSDGDARAEKRLLLKQLAAMSRQFGYPEPVKRCMMRAARKLSADEISQAARDDMVDDLIADMTEKAWTNCLPKGEPTISPDASDEAINANLQLLAMAVSQNMEQAGASEEEIACAKKAISEVDRDELIRMSATPERSAAHLDSLVRACTR